MHKKLIPLAVIAGLLVTVALVQKAGKPKISLSEQYALEELMPQGFRSSDVVRMEMYLGQNEEERVVLERIDDQWFVSSRFNAPGKRDKIEKFLDQLKKLEGEFRTESAEVLEDFSLVEDKALHVRVYRQGEEKAACHLLVGKKESWNRSFVRRSGENSVYTVSVNLASEMGVYGEEMQTPPSAKDWIEKKLMEIKKEDVTKVALRTPERSLIFERREKPKDADIQEEDPSEQMTMEEPQFEWVLAEGGGGFEFKSSGLDDVLRNLETFEALDVDDPSRASEVGLDDPAFRLEASLKGGQNVILLAQMESPGMEAYVVLEGMEDILFKVSNWKFKSLFKLGKDLLELRDLSMKEEGIQKIRISGDAGEVLLARDGEDDSAEWVMQSPKVSLPLEPSKVKDMVKVLTALQPVDYCEGKDLDAWGLHEPVDNLWVSWRDGSSQKVSLGETSLLAEGRYLRVDEENQIWALSKWDTEKLIPSLGDLLDLQVADLDEDDIEEIRVERSEEPFVLSRQGEMEWSLSSRGKDLETREERIEEFLDVFSFLDAKEVRLEENGSLQESVVTIRVKKRDGETLLIELGKPEDGLVPARLDDQSMIFLFEEDVAESLAPSLSELCLIHETTETLEEETMELTHEVLDGDSVDEPEKDSLEGDDEAITLAEDVEKN